MSERILPNSPELEMFVLGAMLQNEQAAYTLPDTITPEVFFWDTHRWIFEAACRCVRRGLACDVHTVAEELTRQRKFEVVGGAYLGQLIECPASPNWIHHARVLQEKAERRQIILAATRIEAHGYADDDPIEEYRAKAEATLYSAMQAGRTGEVMTPAQLAATLDEDAAPVGLATGLALLDAPSPVLAEGRLVVLAGRPGIGKTALACAILVRHALAVPPVPCLFFSCEQAAREIAERVVALRARQTLHAIQTGTRPRDAVERLATGGLHLCHDAAPTLATVLGRIRSERATHGIRLVVLDHIGKVAGGRKETRTLEVGDVARGLKAIAKDLHVPVLVLCQLNRSVESRNVKRPQLSDLRESGEIEQEADAVVFVWTQEDNMNRVPLPVRLTLEKNRHGATGELQANFNGPHLRFVPEDDNGGQAPLR